MKIRLHKFECCDCNSEYWEESGGADEIELPDAIVKEWRHLEERRYELSQYFDERAQSLIDAARQERRKKWEHEHPKEAEQQRVEAPLREAAAQRFIDLMMKHHVQQQVLYKFMSKDEKK